MVLPLRPRLALWVLLSMICIIGDAWFSFTAVVLLLSDAPFGAAVIAAVAMIFLFPTFATVGFTFTLRRSPPTLVVDGSLLTFNVPGLLREPLVLTSDEVHSIYLWPFRPPGHEEPKGAQIDVKMAGRARRVRTLAIAGLGPSRLRRPNLSVLGPPNMLIVFTGDVDVGRLVRPGTGWLSIHRLVEQPLRSAHGVRAIYADVEDQGAARSALLGWPIANEMSDSVIRHLVARQGS